MSIPLERILAAACGLYETTPANARLGFDDRALATLGAFGWLASCCSDQPASTIAAFVARSPALVGDCQADFEVWLAGDAAHAERISAEVAQLRISTHRARSAQRLVDDADPEIIARRLIMAGPAALTTGIAQLRALAAAYLSLIQDQQPRAFASSAATNSTSSQEAARA